MTTFLATLAAIITWDLLRSLLRWVKRYRLRLEPSPAAKRLAERLQDPLHDGSEDDDPFEPDPEDEAVQRRNASRNYLGR